jgi:hypothetical protein
MISQNMQRVKTDILEEMKSLPYVSGDAWADILLRNAKYCKTDKDQQDFWRFILNPKDNREFEDPTFIKAEENIALTPEEVANGDVKLRNEYHQTGGTMFVRTMPLKDNEQDDEKFDIEEAKTTEEE